MWILLKGEQLTRAVGRNIDAEVKLHTSLLARGAWLEARFDVAVSCHNDEHPGGHVCRYKLIGTGDRWGECVVRATGEECPAARGSHICHHLTAGLPTYNYLLENDAEGRELRRAHGEQKARLFDSALGGPAKRPINFGIPL